MTEPVNVSGDLLWEIVRKQSSYIVKRKVGGNAIVFSRDPLNLRNTHSRKHSGSVNEKAIGIYGGEKDSVILYTKKNHEKYSNKPASVINKTVFKGNKSTRKIAAAVVGQTAKIYYRPDLRKDAAARISAIKASQRPLKEDRPVKLRGAKAAKAAAAEKKA
ncbi:ribosomal L28e protein family-domain-containing protein [Kalaharituber pfeilii]|nr:ribosomal L28e protein family-domain-containing protein [Kalaharituber pfeilii]